LEVRDVVAERFTKPAGLEEIALHIDDQKRRAVELDAKLPGFSLEIYCRHDRSLRRYRRERAKTGPGEQAIHACAAGRSMTPDLKLIQTLRQHDQPLGAGSGLMQ
jgi:hypothetical protein